MSSKSMPIYYGSRGSCSDALFHTCRMPLRLLCFMAPRKSSKEEYPRLSQWNYKHGNCKGTVKMGLHTWGLHGDCLGENTYMGIVWQLFQWNTCIPLLFRKPTSARADHSSAVLNVIWIEDSPDDSTGQL